MRAAHAIKSSLGNNPPLPCSGMSLTLVSHVAVGVFLVTLSTLDSHIVCQQSNIS